MTRDQARTCSRRPATSRRHTTTNGFLSSSPTSLWGQVFQPEALARESTP
ncbi:hypothetical protein RchiOBHm_Chr1g0344311 [Rosa chinensis]|uniref:Uncharacterized protein n=1 Tax=Rosa chinensis TaxID=74649 RepID=A0A2P6SEH0_ROSCH|nr:hypothetical protein RchiOBHm_Chr1g0344311 [Rosa chinensis]